MIETPLITNDAFGLAKLVVAIVVGTSPIYGLVIAFLRKGPNDAIARLTTDLNGYGERLNKVDREHAADQQEVGQLVVRMAQSEQDRHGIRNDVTRVENQQAIRAAAHKIELQVASLAAKADVGKELRDGLDRIADIMENRDRRRDRGEVE
jgi:hypothetical protein